MPGKNALLCGVVVPLACLLGLPPAMAAMPKPQAMTFRGDVVRVQAEDPEALLRRQQEEEQQRRQQEEQQAPPPEQAPPPAAPEQPRPAPEPQPEAPAEPRSEPAPQPEPERSPPQPAPEPERAPAETAPEPQRERQREQRREREPAEAAPEPQREREPRREREREPRREREREPQERREAEPSEPAQPPASPVQPESVPVPEQSPAPQEAPVPDDRPKPPADRAPAAERPAEGGAPVAPPVPESAPPQGGAAPEAPAVEPVAPSEAGAAPQEAPPMTPEQLERARAIAEDPATTDETVILPVDRGAAVLDSDKEAEGAARPGEREERRRQRQEAGEIRVPQSDAEAQASREGQPQAPVRIQPATAETGERLDRRPEFERPEGVRERRFEGRGREDGDARIILQFGDRFVVRGDERERFVRDGDEPYYERLPGGRVREVIQRRDGTQVVTITNRYGEVIQRSRIDDRGREYVLFYTPDDGRDRPERGFFRDPGLDLPPMRLGVPLRDYIIDTSSDRDRDYYEFLARPPVEPVERVYSLDEVRYSARIRDKARRIDLDTLTFATGSAEIPMSQARSLRRVADAMNRLLDEKPDETFLIEGHTDAVGSDESNLVLSYDRAESVANVLTDVYGIPPENLVTEGYGERYLKVKTQAPEQQNRRVTIRRVTALVKPVAAN